MKLLSIPSLKGIRLSVLFLGLYFIMLPFDFYKIQSLGSVPRLLAYLPIGLSIVEQIRHAGSVKIKINSITKAGLFVLFAALASLPLSVSKSVSLGALFTLAMNLFMVFLLGSASLYSAKEVKFLEMCLVLGGWLTGILMLSFSNFTINRMVFRLGDSKQDPNYMCGFMLYAFCYHLKRILQPKKSVDILFAGIMIVLVLMSGSRGALLAFLAAIISSILTAKNLTNAGKRKAISGFFLIIITFAVIYVFVIPRINSAITDRFTIQYLLRYGTIGRTDIWKYLLNKYWHSSIVRQIVGFGYGTVYVVNDMPSVGYGHVAHNLHIEMLISAGLLGLIAMITLQVSCVKAAIKEKKWEALCTYISFIAMGLSLSLTSYKPLWALMIMLLIYIKRGEQNDENASDNSQLL